MGKYIIKRVLQFIPVFLGVTLILFSLENIVPGDPIRLIAGDKKLDPVTENNLRASFHLIETNDDGTIKYDENGNTIDQAAQVDATKLVSPTEFINAMRAYMEKNLGMPADLSLSDARTMVGIYYSMRTVGFSNQATYTLADNVPMDLIAYIKEHSADFQGIEIQSEAVRQYDTATAAHLLGTIGSLTSDEWSSDKNGGPYKDKTGYQMSDLIGKSGLESALESYLHGTAGSRTVETDLGGSAIAEQTTATAPKPGDNVITTIDLDLQEVAEKSLESNLSAYGKGGAAVALDPNTGEVLAMANLPDFDPNDAYHLTSEVYINELKTDVQKILTDAKINAVIPDKWYEEGGLANLPEELQKNDDIVSKLGSARVNILMKTWRNPVVSDNYEPGSTFKLMTVATAYELGEVDADSSFYCGGSLMVGDWKEPINCANTSGHGMQTLTEALMNSCNVAMMQIAQKVGMARFYEFYKAFGLLDQTGIDLPGEGKGQFHKLDVASDWNEVALATASFGQRFTVTPIQMLNMVCAIVDDGKLKKPYVVKEVLGGDGSVKSTNETEVVRQVISEDTSAYMREAMEQVVANGTGKNAYVPGYRVGGKTATSEIQPEYDSDGKVLDTEDRYTASFIGVAPMDDPQIAVLVAINDLPESATHTGGTIAAPVVGRIMEDVLPYIGITPVYDDSESDRRELTVPSVSGKTRDDAISTLSDAGFDCIIKGDGDTVTDQVPNAGMRIAASGKVIVYMGEEKPTEAVEVPNLSGMSPDECRDTLEEYGLYLKQKGVSSAQITGDTTATKQSPEAGTKVSLGAVVTVEFSDTTTVNDR